jgi:hypothetical protein
MTLAYLAASVAEDFVEKLAAPQGVAQKAQAFEAAMARQNADPSSQVDEASGGQVVDAVSASEQADLGKQPPSDAENAAQAGAATGGAPGDKILGGVLGIKASIDARLDHIASVSDGSSVTTEKLFALQKEIAEFGLLLDVGSKIVGKSTQTVDTLLKGS